MAVYDIYPSNNMATLSDLIDETLAEIIADPAVKFIDLDTSAYEASSRRTVC